MVLELLAIAVGLAGFGWAGWKDLRTTEFPDWLPYGLIAFGLGSRALLSFWAGSPLLFLNSLLVGGLFLGLGLALYSLKQWGDGDAWLLGAMGFLFPDGLGFPVVPTSFAALQALLPFLPAGLFTLLAFPVMIATTFAFVSLGYIVVYTAVVGARSGKGGRFLKEFRGQIPAVAGVTAAFTLALAGLAAAFRSDAFLAVGVFPLLVFALLAFFHYGKFIEQFVFRRKVLARDLREGDVPVGEKWKVLTKAEIARLRRKGGHVWIKEGVRFAPVFALTIVGLLLLDHLPAALAFFAR